jgi:hypothetical protein
MISSSVGFSMVNVVFSAIADDASREAISKMSAFGLGI